jgi:predicted RNase H-like HicB family nuclease
VHIARARRARAPGWRIGGAAVVRDGEWFVARCLEVEVASQGKSVEEALANLTEALELYFEDEPLVDVPQPIVAPIEVRISA